MSPHVSVPEGEMPEVGVDYPYMGTEGSQVTIFGVHMQTYGVPGSDAGARKGHECLVLQPSLLDGCAVWDGNDCC